MKSSRILSRASRSSRITTLPRPTYSFLQPSTRILTQPTTRLISTTLSRHIRLSPSSSDPPPPDTEDTSTSHANTSPAELSDSEYHEIADQYLDTLVLALEEQAETDQKLEVEYSAGVLTISSPTGTHVINKQPPNKQIWLSSPTSGPKRFDWVLTGSGQHEKQDSEALHGAGDDGEGGRWVYLRDGTGLSELLNNEMGVEIKSGPLEGSDAIGGREGPGGGGGKLE